MFKFTEDISSLHGYTFVIPCLSVGNVPQLTVDLLIETLGMRKIAFAWHSGIVPVVGPPAFGAEVQPTSSCELFASDTKKLVVVQLRAPVAAKSLPSFINELIALMKSSPTGRIIVLASCFAHERHDAALQRNFEYVGNGQFHQMHEKQLQDIVRREQSDERQLPGQGFATRLFEALQKDICDVPIGMLFAYVSEGDNVPEAKDLARFFGKITGLVDGTDVSVLKVPMSWKLLFGNAGPKELF